MTTTVLAFIPSPAQGVWHLGPLPIRAYALCIITGIVAALIIGDRRWVDRGGEPGVIYDIALWAVPFGLVGGRLYHVMTDWRTYFSDGGAGIVGALKIWDGGLGIWGAVALGGVGAWIGCRQRGIPLPAFADAVAPGVILAQAIGRLGNYFNQELYGRKTDVPWGLEIFERRDASGALDTLNGVSTGQLVSVVHPTFLYELIWNVLVFVLLLWADRRFRLGHGRLFALYVAAYCLGRFGVELMRDDFATHIAGIRINSFTSTFVFIGAVVYMMVAPKGREDPAVLGSWRTEDDDAEETAVDTSRLDEVGKELVTVAGTSGLVAAAKTAGAEDGPAEDGPAEDVDVADEADAVETQPDETEVLEPEAEPAADEAEAAEPEADEPEGDAPEADEPEADEPEADEPEADEPAVAPSEPEASTNVDEPAESDAEAPEAAEGDAPEADEPAVAPSEPKASRNVDGSEANGAGAEEADAEESEGDAPEAPRVEPDPKPQPLPAWEPLAPRRRWWQRQR